MPRSVFENGPSLLHTHDLGPDHRSVITWGFGTNMELAYGASGKKSSANPAKCNALDGVHVGQVAAGVGFSVFLAKPDDPKVWICGNYTGDACVPEGGLLHATKP